MALSRHPATSAFWSLSRAKQTLPGPAKIDLINPEQTLGRPGQTVLVSGRLQSFLDTFDQVAGSDWLG
jgi:hypothetical protein